MAKKKPRPVRRPPKPDANESAFSVIEKVIRKTEPEVPAKGGSQTTPATK